MRKLILMAIISLNACGSDMDPTGYIPYVPNEIDKIQLKVAQEENVSQEKLSEVKFYYNKFIKIQDHCNPSFEKTRDTFAKACTDVDDSPMSFFDEAYRDSCPVLIHEMIHQALYLKNGDPDRNHKNPDFLQTNKWCDEIGIKNIMYPEY